MVIYMTKRETAKKVHSLGNVAFERKTWKKYANEQCTYWEKGPLA